MERLMLNDREAAVEVMGEISGFVLDKDVTESAYDHLKVEQVGWLYIDPDDGHWEMHDRLDVVSSGFFPAKNFVPLYRHKATEKQTTDSSIKQ